MENNNTSLNTNQLQMMQQSMAQDILNQYINQFNSTPHTHYVDYDQLKKTRYPQRNYTDYEQNIRDFQKYITDTKSDFEKIIDCLFSLEEKVEFLESLGYRYLPNSSYMVKGEPDPEFKRTYTMEEAFLMEVTIKFKNILLSKQALKFKL